MTLPGHIGNAVPAGEDYLVRRVQDLERELREARAASTLQASSIGQGGLHTENFDGTSFAVPGTMGNYFGYDGAVLNALYLRPGSVSNDTLANPVVAGFFEGSGNATLTVPGSYLFTGTITIPTGFTKAIVLCTATTGGTNASGAGDNLYCQPQIATFNGEQIAAGIPAGYAHSVSASQAILLNPLTGSSISLKVWGATDHAGWTGGNGHLSAAAIFFR